MNILNARDDLKLGKTIFDMKLRVADYGRVSTDKDDQVNSLENQIKFFSDMIDGCDNWTHIASYSDEGISGTQVNKREQFLKMIEDAKLGKIDLIVTKEVSRFARNTIDSIKYTQMLLSYGVIVYFLNDNINTIYPDSEFRLTLMASMAQDEVRKLSERVKFGIRRSIKDRKVGGGGTFGYYKKNCKLTINEDEEKIVRRIYEMYVTGNYGLTKIGHILANEGIYTRSGKVFSDTTLKKMIKNPRYKGYYTASLTVVEDYKTHKKIKVPKEKQIIEKDTSGNVPAIVSEKLWNDANELLTKRGNKNRTILNRSDFIENSKYTSKMFCLEHNMTFIKSGAGKHKDDPVWACNGYLRHGISGCKSPLLRESYLDKIFIKIISGFINNKDKFLNEIINDYTKLLKNDSTSNSIKELENKLNEENQIKDRLMNMLLRNIISEKEFISEKNKINSKIEEINKKIFVLKSQKEDKSYYENIAKSIKEKIDPELDIEINLKTYFNLLIDKVFVSKINNDRKHIKLDIIFNFKTPEYHAEIELNKKSNYRDNSNFKIDFLRDKYLLLAPKEPRVCSNGAKTREE